MLNSRRTEHHHGSNHSIGAALPNHTLNTFQDFLSGRDSSNNMKVGPHQLTGESANPANIVVKPTVMAATVDMGGIHRTT